MSTKDRFKRLEERMDKKAGKLEDMNKKLREIKDEPAKQAEPEKKDQAPKYLTEDAFKEQMERFLTNSFETMGDKISSKMQAMLSELKSAGGAVSPARMREIKQAAAEENVDISGLFNYKGVDSNIDKIGIEEKQAKGIDKSLEKLRKMMRKNKE